MLAHAAQRCGSSASSSATSTLGRRNMHTSAPLLWQLSRTHSRVIIPTNGRLPNKELEYPAEFCGLTADQIISEFKVPQKWPTYKFPVDMLDKNIETILHLKNVTKSKAAIEAFQLLTNARYDRKRERPVWDLSRGRYGWDRNMWGIEPQRSLKLQACKKADKNKHGLGP